MSKLICDIPISAAIMRQFASQRVHTSDSVLNTFKGMYEGKQSDDFYKGLLAGLATSHVFNTNGMTEHLPHLLAFIAGEMEKKEIS